MYLTRTRQPHFHWFCSSWWVTLEFLYRMTWSLSSWWPSHCLSFHNDNSYVRVVYIPNDLVCHQWMQNIVQKKMFFFFLESISFSRNRRPHIERVNNVQITIKAVKLGNCCGLRLSTRDPQLSVPVVSWFVDPASWYNVRSAVIYQAGACLGGRNPTALVSCQALLIKYLSPLRNSYFLLPSNSIIMSSRGGRQSMSELRYRRLLEHNQRLREDLARPRIRVSEAAARWDLVFFFLLKAKLTLPIV